MLSSRMKLHQYLKIGRFTQTELLIEMGGVSFVGIIRQVCALLIFISWAFRRLSEFHPVAGQLGKFQKSSHRWGQFMLTKNS